MLSGLALSKEEVEFYSRQILSFQRVGQLRLKQSRIVVLGAGGIGSALLPILVASGVGHIIFFEDDYVERSNLSRQLLYTELDVGKFKGEVALKKLQAQNPYIRINYYPFKLDATFLHDSIFQDINLIIDGTDSMKTKLLINRFSSENKISSIIASLSNRQAHIVIQNHKIDLGEDIGCYECLFGDLFEKTNEISTCAMDGIISTNSFLIGSYVAYQAIQYLLDEKKMLSALFLFENSIFRRLTLGKRFNCVNCS